MESDAQSSWNAWKRPTYVVAGLLGAFMIIQWNAERAVIRFEDPFLNYAAFEASCLLPIAAFAYAFRLPRWWGTATAATVLLLPSLWALIFGSLGMIETVNILHKGVDYSYEPIQKIEMPSYTVMISRTDGGATTAFGIAVRQEKKLLPGILLVRDFPGFYPAHDATGIVTGPDTITIDVPSYGDEAGRRSCTYHFTRFLYF